MKKGVVKNFIKFTGKHLRQRLSFNKVAGLGTGTSLKRDSKAVVFLRTLGNFEIFRNNFLTEHIQVTASRFYDTTVLNI